jgi:hypothetical protein
LTPSRINEAGSRPARSLGGQAWIGQDSQQGFGLVVVAGDLVPQCAEYVGWTQVDFVEQEDVLANDLDVVRADRFWRKTSGIRRPVSQATQSPLSHLRQSLKRGLIYLGQRVEVSLRCTQTPVAEPLLNDLQVGTTGEPGREQCSNHAE